MRLNVFDRIVNISFQRWASSGQLLKLRDVFDGADLAERTNESQPDQAIVRLLERVDYRRSRGAVGAVAQTVSSGPTIFHWKVFAQEDPDQLTGSTGVSEATQATDCRYSCFGSGRLVLRQSKNRLQAPQIAQNGQHARR